MEMPKIVTSCKVKGTNFILHVYAYRKLNNAEMRIALRMYLAQKKINKFPMSGEDKLTAIHGFDGEPPLI